MCTQDTQLTLKVATKMHLKMLSAANNKLLLLTNLSIEANSVDPDHNVCHRDLYHISADN